MPVYDMEKVAQAGYEAYAESTHGKNHRGDDMPTWKTLPAVQKKAWLDATQAITFIFNRFMTEASE